MGLTVSFSQDSVRAGSASSAPSLRAPSHASWQGKTSKMRGRTRVFTAGRARPAPPATWMPRLRRRPRETRREPRPQPRKKRKMATKVTRKLKGSEELGFWDPPGPPPSPGSRLRGLEGEGDTELVLDDAMVDEKDEDEDDMVACGDR